MIILLFSVLLSCSFNCMTVAEDSPCAARWEEEGPGYVCVCNSTYCDTVEQPQKLTKGAYYMYKTSNSTPGFTKTKGSFVEIALNTESDILFTIDSTVEYQEIIGFGGAVTDSSCINIYSLPQQASDNLIESYFGPNGIEYSMLRLPIGGTDFSTRSYTLDDGSLDKNLDNFSLTDEDYKLKIPLIQKANNVSGKNMKLLACAWTAPKWMKDVSNGPTYVIDELNPVWAMYYIKFLEGYREQGLEVWSVSGSNEGMLAIMLPAIGSSTTLVVYAHAQRAWLLEYLKPLLVSHNFTNVKFLAMEDQNIYGEYWMSRFASDKDAYAAVDGIALHWYADYFVPYTSNILEDTHAKYPDKLILNTESSCNGVCGQEAVVLGSWYRGETYSYDIMKNLNHWSNSYLDWNLALNLDGGPTIGYGIEAPVIVNQTSGEFYKQPMFYSLGHFSKFVQPGARRVNVTTRSYSKYQDVDKVNKGKMSDLHKSNVISNLLRPGAPYSAIISVPQEVNCFAASNPDSSFTVIVLNTEDVPRTVHIKDTRLGSIFFEAEEHSINTFVYWP